MKKKRFFKTMLAPIILGAMTVLFTACPHSKPVYVDLGRIPEQYLATVPYQDGDVFKMQHETSKLIIDFEVSRHRSKETDYEYQPMRYKPAPNYFVEYELDQTICKPDYPIFDVNIDFSNKYMAYEEEELQSWEKRANLFAVGNARFPFIGEDHSNYEVLDSLEINDRYYHEVFKLKAEYYPNYEGDETIHVETFYYNYENGLLGILMSNGEKYWLYEN